MDEPAPIQSADPEMLLGEEGWEGGDSDLGKLLELKPAVASFLQGSPEALDKEGKKMLPEPPSQTLPNGSTGKRKGVTPPAGGWNYPQFQEKMMPGNLPGR